MSIAGNIQKSELAKEVKANRQVNVLGSVLQVVDRAVSGVGTLQVVVKDLGSCIARTNGKTIWMNRTKVEEIFASQDLPDAIRIFQGTNYHELAHVLFSPRSDDAIGQWVQTNMRFKWAWNALEDQRIETLFTALYPDTVPYFRNSSHTWLLNNPNPETLYRAYTLIGGRRYLDRKVRLAARKAFIGHYGAEAADECDRIVQEYVALVLPGPTATQRAMELTEEFYNLLRDTTQQQERPKEGEGACGNDGAAKEGEVDPERVVEAARRVLEDQEQEAAEEPQDAPEAGNGAAYPEDVEEDDSEPQEGASGESDDEGQGGQTGDDSEGDEGQGEGETDQDNDLDENGGEGASKGDPDAEVPEGDPIKDLEDAILEAQADVLTDENLKEEVEKTLEAFKAQANRKGDAEVHNVYTDYSMQPASPEARSSVAKVTAMLRRIQVANEPGTLRRQHTGKVNVRRAIRNAVDPTTFDIFDKWDEGAEVEASTEVVIALDLSGSMRRVLPQASEALWVLKKAFDSTNGIRTTVFGFSEGNATLYKGGEKCEAQVRRFSDWGGTDANPTHHAAYRVLTTSPAANKILITITDGMWDDFEGDGKDAENVVAALRNEGAHTLLFGINGHRSKENEHNYEHCANLTTITDLVGIVGGLVKGVQAAARKGGRAA